MIYLRLISFLLLSTYVIADADALLEGWFRGVVDNREYSSSVAIPQTIIGSIGSVALTIPFTDARYRLGAGTSYFAEFGHGFDDRNIFLLLYLQYREKPDEFYFGRFMRQDVFSYPTFLYSDSSQYYRPLMEGAVYARSFTYGRHFIWIDWTSRQTEDAHEAFLCGLAGEYSLHLLNGRFMLQYYHLAGRMGQIVPEIVRDNGGLVLTVSSSSKSNTFIDRFIDSSIVTLNSDIAFDRLREGKASWHTPVGLETEIAAFKGPFEASLTYFRKVYTDNDDIQKKTEVLWGDPLYAAKEFGRFDFIYKPIRKKKIHCSLNFSFYLIEQKIDYRQWLLLDANLTRNLFGKS